MNYALAGVIGLVGGIVSGLFGVGGGVIMVPAMLFFTALGMRGDTQQAVGTSLVVIIPTAIVGMWRHHTLGNIKWSVALILIPTAILGGWIGATLTREISSDNLKRLFGGFLIIVGCRLVFWK